jgi:hypothetical protein
MHYDYYLTDAFTVFRNMNFRVFDLDRTAKDGYL